MGLKHGDVQNAPATASFSRPNGALATAGGLIFGPKIPVILMTVWEVKFLLAEAAARGFAGGDAKALYEAAMYANSDYLGSDSASMSKYISEKGAFDPSNAIKSIAACALLDFKRRLITFLAACLAELTFIIIVSLNNSIL